MSQANASLRDAQVEPSLEPAAGWLEEIAELLERAAQLAAANGIEGEVWKRAAWNAYLDARPGLRKALETKALKAQLRRLRKRGMVGQA